MTYVHRTCIFPDEEILDLVNESVQQVNEYDKYMEMVRSAAGYPEYSMVILMRGEVLAWGPPQR